jgi:hypothetical protein
MFIKKIEFKQVSPTEVEIIGVGTDSQTPDAPEVKREIGCIFTPSGTGHDCIDCIQVCGFEEAFDLWGCGRYQKPKVKEWGEYSRDKNGKREFEYVRDIQLKFNWETHGASKHPDNGKWANNCHKCFNEPCTCEIKERYANPYTVKREHVLHILKKKEEIKDGDKTIITDN